MLVDADDANRSSEKTEKDFSVVGAIKILSDFTSELDKTQLHTFMKKIKQIISSYQDHSWLLVKTAFEVIRKDTAKAELTIEESRQLVDLLSQLGATFERLPADIILKLIRRNKDEELTDCGIGYLLEFLSNPDLKFKTAAAESLDKVLKEFPQKEAKAVQKLCSMIEIRKDEGNKPLFGAYTEGAVIALSNISKRISDQKHLSLILEKIILIIDVEIESIGATQIKIQEKKFCNWKAMLDTLVNLSKIATEKQLVLKIIEKIGLFMLDDNLRKIVPQSLTEINELWKDNEIATRSLEAILRYNVFLGKSVTTIFCFITDYTIFSRILEI